LVALISPVNGGELGAAIRAAFRCRGFEKPNQYECAKRHHRDAARQNRFDIIAIGVLEPFAHLFLPAGITSIVVFTCWLGGLQFVHLGPVRPTGTRIERDGFSSNRHLALSFYLSMIFSENRCPLFRIML
jgi:hypothetical protein